MNEATEGQTFCPKFEEIIIKSCTPPSRKDILVQKFLEEMRVREVKLHGVDVKHLPYKIRLINMVTTLVLEDEIFHKSFVPPQKRRLLKS